MKFNTKKNHKSKTKLIIITTVMTVLLAGGVTYALYTNNSSKNSFDPSKQGVNLERTDSENATEEALKNNPEQKLENSQNDTPSVPSETTTSGKQAVNVVLTNAGIYSGTDKSTVSAGGMVTNITEDTGVCTYTFTNQSTVVTKTSSTLVNPTSTTCSTVSFPSSELSKSGTWVVKLKYSSDKSEGISNQKEIIQQ